MIFDHGFSGAGSPDEEAKSSNSMPPQLCVPQSRLLDKHGCRKSSSRRSLKPVCTMPVRLMPLDALSVEGLGGVLSVHPCVLALGKGVCESIWQSLLDLCVVQLFAEPC